MSFGEILKSLKNDQNSRVLEIFHIKDLNNIYNCNRTRLSRLLIYKFLDFQKRFLTDLKNILQKKMGCKIFVKNNKGWENKNHSKFGYPVEKLTEALSFNYRSGVRLSPEQCVLWQRQPHGWTMGWNILLERSSQ